MEQPVRSTISISPFTTSISWGRKRKRSMENLPFLHIPSYSVLRRGIPNPAEVGSGIAILWRDRAIHGSRVWCVNRVICSIQRVHLSAITIPKPRCPSFFFFFSFLQTTHGYSDYAGKKNIPEKQSSSTPQTWAHHTNTRTSVHSASPS